MEKEYTFEFDEEVRNALEMKDVIYDFLSKYRDRYASLFDPEMLDFKLRTKSFHQLDLEDIFECIGRKIG